MPLKDLFEDDAVETTAMTDTQKKVLVKIKAAATPKVAHEDVSKDPNDVAARDMLKSMNLIDIVGSSIALNDSGEEALRDEGLTDEMGNLLPGAKERYLKGENGDKGEASMAGGPIGGENLSAERGLGMGESFSLIKEIIRESNFLNNR